MEHFDLINGGSTIYPADTVSWLPNFFKKSALDQMAYDVVAAPELVWFTHPSNHLTPNIFYSRSNGRPGGIQPKVPVWTQRMFDWVCTHDCCLLHRDKEGACIDFLRKKLFDSPVSNA
jgi:hypothetical protein